MLELYKNMGIPARRLRDATWQTYIGAVAEHAPRLLVRPSDRQHELAAERGSVRCHRSHRSARQDACQPRRPPGRDRMTVRPSPERSHRASPTNSSRHATACLHYRHSRVIAEHHRTRRGRLPLAGKSAYRSRKIAVRTRETFRATETFRVITRTTFPGATTLRRAYVKPPPGHERGRLQRYGSPKSFHASWPIKAFADCEDRQVLGVLANDEVVQQP